MSNFPINENQISGVKDDGSPEGHVKTRNVFKDIYAYPFEQSKVAKNVAGAGSAVTFNQSSSGIIDTSNSNIAINCAAGIGTSIAVAALKISGKTVGIKIRKTSVIPDFYVEIDGKAYDFPVDLKNAPKIYNQFQDSLANSPFWENEAVWIIADDLDDIIHTVRIVLYPASISKTLVLTGYIADTKPIIPSSKKDIIGSQGAVTAALTDVPVTYTSGSVGTMPSGQSPVFLIKSILYTNTDTVDRVLTVKYKGGNVVVKKIAANDVYTLKLSEDVGFLPYNVTSNLQHSCDITDKIYFSVITNQL